MNKKEEIFTIGDKCKEGIILSFSIIHGRCRVNFTGGHSLDLKLVNKVKQPLFTTEDGVDVFEYNHPALYYVNVYYYYIGMDDPNTLYYPDIKNFKYFSTREKAEEYILMNKPCLSIQDLLDTKGVYFEGDSKLKELVKQRL